MPDNASHRPPRKIVHAVLRLDVGGLERMVLNLAQANLSRGDLPHLVCVESRGMLADELEATGVPIFSLAKPPGRHPQVIAQAMKHLQTIQPDLVHTHQIGAAWYVATASKRLGIPVLHTEHGNLFARLPGRLARWKSRLFLWNAARQIDRFGCISEEIAREVQRFPGVAAHKIRRFPNGIILSPPPSEEELHRLREQFQLPTNAMVLGTVGRLNEVKRQCWILDAVAALRETFPTLIALFVGDGPERDHLESQASELGIGDRVRFTGYQANPIPYLHLMTVFALPSRSEGFPVSLLEAWNCRLPVVCSAVGGIPQIVREGENGLLFAQDDFSGFQQRLIEVLTDESCRVRLGDAGRREVETHYSLDRMAELYNASYEELIQTRKERS